MSAEALRRAAALMRDYGARGIAREEPWDGDYAADKGWLAPEVALEVADWLDAEAQAHIHVPGSDRPKPAYDMPGMDTSPALAVARAYLGDT